MSDGFLSRWARRKREVRAAEVDPAEVQVRLLDPQREGETRLPLEIAHDDRQRAEEPVSLPVPNAASADAEPELLAELPSLEDLTAQTDLTPFLRAGVPAALRKAALRKMWSIDPAIRDFVSEARDYAYDWNTPGGVPGTGPLLPGDDVKAMLQRLFNRDPSEAEPMTAETDRMQAPPSPDPDPELTATLEQPNLASEPMPAADPAISPEMPAATASNTVAMPRLRRHGGAMPS